MKRIVIVMIIDRDNMLMQWPPPWKNRGKAYDEYLFRMTKGNCTYIEGKTPLSLDKVVELLKENQKVIVFPKVELYRALIQEPEAQDAIDSLHVIQLPETAYSVTMFEAPSMLYWRPVIKDTGLPLEHSPPCITFTRYLHSPLEL